MKTKFLYLLLAAPLVAAGMKFVSKADESPLVGMKAPELQSGSWINSTPLRLSGLHGKVVVLEFWTFGCVNCRNTIPHVREWFKKFNGNGVAIIGVHTPEFDAEKSLSGLDHAIKELGIEYAVVTDNDDRTWDAYGQEYWPTVYVIDKKGIVRYIHVGEGNYDETEQTIKSLLSEPG
ncbi:MAG TPA: redoxin domain-containing protein [Bacteroidota bacterium]|nr:redoxin domain-containing protein [Bacteroidota bacterium]